MAMASDAPYFPSSRGFTSLLAKNTIVRYRKKMVRADRMAFIALTATAAFIGPAHIEKNLANSWNTGFPGGCPTSSLYDDAMNSPQSQKEAVGSMVERYVKAETAKTSAATIRFHILNLLLSIKSIVSQNANIGKNYRTPVNILHSPQEKLRHLTSRKPASCIIAMNSFSSGNEWTDDGRYL